MKEVFRKEAMTHVKAGKNVASSLVTWQREQPSRKPRFVLNLSIQINHWPNSSLNLETLEPFATKVE